MELTKRFTDEQYAQALSSWDWLDLTGRTPRFASLFGDLFLEDEQGAWWHLDTFEGRLDRRWPDAATLTAELNTEEGQDRFLLGALAMAAFHRRGLELGPDEVYAWAPPPMITGSFAVDEIQVFTFVAVLTIMGQTHRQLG
ncbi:hypothetical protein Acy02nite_01060 [Actinoplanes cyaneus]|uniref:T6SS immunity protein Tdi1 C-terminal domain-containing protein n=1 Tax=Actinoplanes cyaneus TaxID=52696 RepID=A0A919LXS8_9ACTN|nr:hypothetical protein [Actinoplanes cyaneus]MCW2142678.1 hypothetical protein [Actinoplanes cyaneus]GID62225.1 hypothetical protein Acy02nite_01060 [Actinoplanes cyaneus]